MQRDESVDRCFDASRAHGPTRRVRLDRVVDLLVVSHAPERIADYRQAMRRGERFPPIAVLRCGWRFVVTDGHKRLSAFRDLGSDTLVVEIWSWRRWLRDQRRQLVDKTRQQWDIARRSRRDPRARQEAVRLWWDTIGHWQRALRSLRVGWRAAAVAPATDATAGRPSAALTARSRDAMVLIATYMEAGTICRLIDELRRHLPQARIVIVDDQSPDGTADLARAHSAGVATVEVVSRPGPRAYGAAIREGFARFLASDATWLLTLDADFSHDPAVTARMLERAADAGLVIGSRYVHGVPLAAWAAGRMCLSIVGNWYVRRVTGLPVADCTSGLRCYTRAAVEQLDLTQLEARGFALQVEMLHTIWRTGLPLAEVPIHYRDRLVGKSKLDLPIVIESLRMPWRLRRRRAPAGGAVSGAATSGTPRTAS